MTILSTNQRRVRVARTCRHPFRRLVPQRKSIGRLDTSAKRVGLRLTPNFGGGNTNRAAPLRTETSGGNAPLVRVRYNSPAQLRLAFPTPNVTLMAHSTGGCGLVRKGAARFTFPPQTVGVIRTEPYEPYLSCSTPLFGY